MGTWYRLEVKLAKVCGVHLHILLASLEFVTLRCPHPASRNSFTVVWVFLTPVLVPVQGFLLSFVILKTICLCISQILGGRAGSGLFLQVPGAALSLPMVSASLSPLFTPAVARAASLTRVSPDTPCRALGLGDTVVGILEKFTDIHVHSFEVSGNKAPWNNL